MVTDNTKIKVGLGEELRLLRLELERIQSLSPIIVTSLESGIILFLNDSASLFFGIPVEDAIGLRSKGFWPDLKMRDAFTTEVRLHGQVREYQTRLVSASKGERHVLLNANLLVRDGEETIYTAIVDITRQKEAEEALIKSRKLHQDLYNLMELMADTVPDLIWAKDLDSRYLFANKAIRTNLLQCGPQESPIGKTDHFFAKREKEKGHRHTFDKLCMKSDEVVKRSRKPQKFLQEGYIRDKFIIIDVHKAPMFDAEGNLIGTVGAGRDVTVDINIQNELRESEARYRLLADNVRDVIWTTDNRLNITYVTPSIFDLIGYTAEEFLKRNKEDQLTPNFRKRFAAVTRLLRREVKQQNPTTRLWEFECYHQNGHVLWLETSTSAIYNSTGKFEGFVCVTRETTKKVQAQIEMEQARKEALLASHAKSEFLANMSHEIRTPMNGVLGMLQLLQKTPLTNEQQAYVDTALSSGTSLLKIISDILDFSKIEAGKIDLEETRFCLKPVINSIIASFENLINHDQVQLAAHLADDLPSHIIGDETRMRQILFNLIGNAVKFTDKGAITLRLTCGDAKRGKVKLLFEVQDTGIGVSPEKIQTLFEPFVQADGSFRRQYSGTGLGLSIVKRLVQLMGGKVTITSRKGRGTTVAFDISVKPVVAAEVAREATIAANMAEFCHQRVLVVEDENINALVVTAMLEKLGHSPTVVNNGQGALDILKKEHFDCILMDIQMPLMDGIETARAIRNNDCANCRKVPIIALTAHAMKGDRERFLAAGMNDYLTKPLKISDLVEILQTYSLPAAQSQSA